MITGRGFACKLGICASSLPSKWVQSRAAGALGNQHLRDIDRVSRPAGARCAGLHLGHRGQPVGRDLQELLRQAVRGGVGGARGGDYPGRDGHRRARSGRAGRGNCSGWLCPFPAERGTASSEASKGGPAERRCAGPSFGPAERRCAGPSFGPAERRRAGPAFGPAKRRRAGPSFGPAARRAAGWDGARFLCSFSCCLLPK